MGTVSEFREVRFKRDTVFREHMQFRVQRIKLHSHMLELVIDLAMLVSKVVSSLLVVRM